MAKFVSSSNRVTARALKRKALGAVVVRHYGREDVRFTRVNGGWMRDTVVVSSAAVANECNKAVGCKESWARVY